MSKEQFKTSLVNLFNYYITNMIQYNLEAKEAGDDEGIARLLLHGGFDGVHEAALEHLP